MMVNFSVLICHQKAAIAHLDAAIARADGSPVARSLSASRAVMERNLRDLIAWRDDDALSSSVDIQNLDRKHGCDLRRFLEMHRVTLPDAEIVTGAGCEQP